MREQVVVIGEHGTQRRTMIVIAGQQPDRHRQGLQEIAQEAVLRFAAEIHQIAGDDDDVGQLRRGEQGVDGGAQRAGGIDPAVRQLAARLDMEIGQLRDQGAAFMLSVQVVRVMPLREA
jgi:hypothetical protein